MKTFGIFLVLLLYFVCGFWAETCPSFKVKTLKIQEIQTKYWKISVHLDPGKILQELPFFIPHECYRDWPNIYYSMFHQVESVEESESNELVFKDLFPHVCPIQRREAHLHLIDTDFSNFVSLYRCEVLKNLTIAKSAVILRNPKYKPTPENLQYTFDTLENQLNLSTKLLKTNLFILDSDNYIEQMAEKCNFSVVKMTEESNGDDDEILDDGFSLAHIVLIQIVLYFGFFAIYMLKCYCTNDVDLGRK